jgi:hypothetical protein
MIYLLNMMIFQFANYDMTREQKKMVAMSSDISQLLVVLHQYYTPGV